MSLKYLYRIYLKAQVYAFKIKNAVLEKKNGQKCEKTSCPIFAKWFTMLCNNITVKYF